MGSGGGGEGEGGGALSDLRFFFSCSADHERDWPSCKVVLGLVVNVLNIQTTIRTLAVQLSHRTQGSPWSKYDTFATSELYG